MGAKKQKQEESVAAAAAGSPTASAQKSDFLKLFWTLAESDSAVRTQAAAQLLAHLRQSEKQEAEVQYTLKRLVRGLASSRDAARQGFGTALAGLLAAFPKQVALSDARELLREAMEVHASMKPMEQREHMFGRLFGLLSLHRSGRLSGDLPLLAAVVKELLEMANFKRWFREACFEAALSLLADVPADLFLSELAAPIHACLQIQPSKGSEEDGITAWNADQVLLAVGVQRYLHATGIEQDDEQKKLLPENFAAIGALRRHHVHLLVTPLRSSSGCYPHVHSAWFGVFGNVLTPTEDASALDGELFQETWSVLVENSLVGGNSSADGALGAPTSHERQGLALKLFELVAPKLPAPVLRAILTPRFVKCLYNNAVAKKNYLHDAARHCLQVFAASAPTEFFHFFRKQFASPLAVLVSASGSADSDDEEEEEEEEKPSKKQKLSAGGFNQLVELEEEKERIEALNRRTDRARVWALEAIVAAITEQLTAKREEEATAKTLEDDMLRFLVFHAFFTSAEDAKSTPSKKSKKSKKAKKSTAIDEVAQEAAAATPALSENVAAYAKTRLFSLLSLGLAGADGARANASVLSRLFAIAQELQADTSAVVLREPLSEAVTEQLNVLTGHVESLRSQEEEEADEKKTKKTATSRTLGETFLLLFMSAGLQLLDPEQREDAAVVAADLDKCFAQLLTQKKATPSKKKSKTQPEEQEEESMVVLTDLLLSLLAQDSSALREIVTQAFRSLLPLLNAACLSTMVNVLQPQAEGEGAAGRDDEEDDEFAPVTRREDEEEDEAEADEDEEEEEEEVVLSSANDVSEALRGDAKLAALHQEDLALAAIVGQVKHRAQRKKDAKRARLQTLHFQLRVVDLLQVFVSQRVEQSEASAVEHSALVLSLVAPLFLALARVQKADAEKRVLSDRLQAVLLHKVFRAKDKELPASESARSEALDALRQVVEVVRTTPLEKDQAGKVASAAVVYLVRVLCSHEATSAVQEEVEQVIRTAVLDAFTKKHSRFPRASFDELLTKFPAVGARVLLEPLAAVAAASEKEKSEEGASSETPAAVDEFSQCEVFRLLALLLRGSSKLQQSGELSKTQRSAFARVQTALKTALVRQLAPETQQHLKAKRMKLVMAFALQLVKFWRSSETKKATAADLRELVAAVQAMTSNSPVIKSMVKQVVEAAGGEAAASNGAKAEKQSPAKDEDELMPEQDDDDVAEVKKPKTKKSKGKSPKDKQKKKRKRSIAEE
ncbi:hypothetical protein BBJ28_00004551 [Nothophytophthora sp. Chile5]|nr:hypothetical protein BBJ28_00004551 [Nothophytophthora sp. Chile5]